MSKEKIALEVYYMTTEQTGNSRKKGRAQMPFK